MNGKKEIGILLICLGLIISAAVVVAVVVLPIAIIAAATASPFTPFSQVPGKNDPAENRASFDVLPSPDATTNIMPVSTNASNNSTTESSNTIVSTDSSRRIIMRESFKTEYTLDHDSMNNKTLHATIAKGARDQLSDAVHTIASNSATINATGIIRNLLTDTTAQLYGMEIIEDVARSQIESALLILSNGGNQTATTTGMTATGSQLTLETETELTCEYMNRSYAECKITMNIG
jgi:hypothetical protein